MSMTIQEIDNELGPATGSMISEDARYFVTANGDTLSFKTVRDNWARILWEAITGTDDAWNLVSTGINDTGELMYDNYSALGIDYEELSSSSFLEGEMLDDMEMLDNS